MTFEPQMSIDITRWAEERYYSNRMSAQKGRTMLRRTSYDVRDAVQPPFWVEQLQPIPCSAFVYRVQPGDTLFIIAQRFDIDVEALIATNPQVMDPNEIEPGELLCVPGRPQCPKEIDGIVYTVLPGDTLDQIAQTFGVSVEEIVAVNPQVQDVDEVIAGEALCIPRPSRPRFPCCVFLSPTAELPPEVQASGSVLVQGEPQGPEGAFLLSFLAVGLPEPDTFGEYDGYVGVIQVGEELSPAILQPTTFEGQPETWAGSQTVEEIAIGEGIVSVRPLNQESGESGAPILRGFVAADCIGT